MLYLIMDQILQIEISYILIDLNIRHLDLLHSNHTGFKKIRTKNMEKNQNLNLPIHQQRSFAGRIPKKLNSVNKMQVKNKQPDIHTINEIPV